MSGYRFYLPTSLGEVIARWKAGYKHLYVTIFLSNPVGRLFASAACLPGSPLVVEAQTLRTSARG